MLAVVVAALAVMAFVAFGGSSDDADDGAPASAKKATPTVTTTTAPTTTLAEIPSGFPTPNSTGVPKGTQLKEWTGSDSVNESDLPQEVRNGTSYTVMDGYHFDSGPSGRYLAVDVARMIIRNSRFSAQTGVSNTGAIVQVGADNDDLIVEHSEFDGGPAYNRGVQSDVADLTITASQFHNTGEAGVEKNNPDGATSLTVRDSYFTNSPGWPADDHVDGIQVGGGKDVTIEHNTVLNPVYGGKQGDDDYVSNSALGLWAEIGNVTGDVVIKDNLLGGGGYTVYLQAKPPYSWRGTATVTGNVFDTRWSPVSGRWGPLFTSGLPSKLTWSNNSYSTGAPLTLAEARAH